MQNAGLKDNVKRNIKILIEAIKTASFLNDECIQKGKSESINKISFGAKGRDRVKPQHFIEWGRVGFVANKRTKTTKMNNNGTPMLMVGYALDHPSGTYRFYDPSKDSLIVSNSVKWSTFTPWKVTAVGETMGILKITPKSTKTESDNTNNDYETIKTETTNEAEVKTESTELLATP